MKPIIEVNHVWKEYQKGIDRRYKSLRDTLVEMPGRFFGAEKEKFWALEDINFKVEAGESIGIIGRNGAGKSTLLKILSRITPPTKGEIILRGRVASLLEVGTGFHPELTGRENVFFNGSILGMKHQEIKRKFDEIVDFSGVEDFIDTPLKHYSSGMQMRLAFSVAAHLDAEILLIDEVLAVGDAEFQKKCVGKMDDVSKGEGKTILFVSHQINLLDKICSLGIILDKTIILKSFMTNALRQYIKHNRANIVNNHILFKYGSFSFDILNCKRESVNKLITGEFYSFLFNFEIRIPINNFNIGIGINKSDGTRIVTYHTKYQLNQKLNISNNTTIECKVHDLLLIDGIYDIEISLFDHDVKTIFNDKYLTKLEIITTNFFKTGLKPNNRYQGIIVQNSIWEINSK
jgi:lipopolysaccharide transport system ATP-binding protein